MKVKLAKRDNLKNNLWSVTALSLKSREKIISHKLPSKSSVS